MRKFSKCIVILFLFLSLVGCQKEKTQNDFMKFAEECRAKEYYQTVDKFTGDAQASYYYNRNIDFIFKTETMLKKCKFDEQTFKQVVSDIKTDCNFNQLFNDYLFNEAICDIYITKNEITFYRDFKEFGFIAINENNNTIDFYWFYDQDYDMIIDDEESFEEFYLDVFSWVSDQSDS